MSLRSRIYCWSCNLVMACSFRSPDGELHHAPSEESPHIISMSMTTDSPTSGNAQSDLCRAVVKKR